MVALVCGDAEEAPMALLIRSLEKKRSSYRLLDQKRLADQVQLRWQVSRKGIAGHLTIGDETLDIREIRSVYHRFTNPEEASGTAGPPHSVQKSRSILHALMSLFDVLPARIVNRRRPMMSNNSKPYQALLIRQAGFSIPETLITNAPAALTAFASAQGPLVYKSISSVRSVVAVFDKTCAPKMASLKCLPTQFQRKIEGFNVRVHVLGRRLFATQILTSATDYRYAGREGATASLRPYALTQELRQKCLRLARTCELTFAGIDLIIGSGKVYCLEVNPSPGYSYYQEATGQPISDALAEYLTRE